MLQDKTGIVDPVVDRTSRVVYGFISLGLCPNVFDPLLSSKGPEPERPHPSPGHYDVDGFGDGVFLHPYFSLSRPERSHPGPLAW